jgi:hypothetical protein
MSSPPSFDFPPPHLLVSAAAETLYTSLQNCIVQEGRLEEFASLRRIYEMITVLQNMGEMQLLNSMEAEKLRQALFSLENEVVRCDRDLKERLAEAEKELHTILISFQNGSTRCKIILLLAHLPNLLFQPQGEETTKEMRKIFAAKILPLQKFLSEKTPLELSRFQRRLAFIEETFQKKAPFSHFSEKDLDHFLHNLQN